MKKSALKILSVFLVSILLFAGNTTAMAFTDFLNPLEKSEKEVRFSTPLTGSITGDIEIIGVTVLPHTKSGNITYNSTDSNSTNNAIGAVVHIYLKNKTDSDIKPQVKFNGKTASEYIDIYPQQISWASTPDTRSNRRYDKELSEEFDDFRPLTTHIPAGSIDCYSINVTDGNLIYDGLLFEISANGKTGSMTLYADYQYVGINSIKWSSSYNDKCFSDTMEYYIENRSSDSVRVNYIKFYEGTDNYWLHYWKAVSDKKFDAETINVDAHDVAFGKVKFDTPLVFRENVIEFNITNGSNTYSLLYKVTPLIYDFDISVGWASEDIEKESYIKTISSMHFNTVIGAFDSSYYLRDEAFRKQYPIKIFGYDKGTSVSDKMTIENGKVTVYDIDDIHAALPFGEPQLNDGDNKHQPMRVFNKLATHRNSPFPTNVTLTHEPAFYRFAGLSNFCHYDAYRVVAPYSDPWYAYTDYIKENKYALYWGAPLETTGDYMRSLYAMNRPNPVAAWTQGAHNWDTFPRMTSQTEYMFSPNPYELRIQAYLNVANGASSLYWFNIKGPDLLYFKESGLEMMYCNREFTTVSDYLTNQITYSYKRVDNTDLNVNIGADYALLFATDLNYSVSDGQYSYKKNAGERNLNFDIPSYLSDFTQLVKVSKDGVSLIDYTANGNSVTVTDNLDMTALYVLGYDGLYNKLKENYDKTVARETFNIYENKDAYNELQQSYGYSDENPYRPQETERNKILYKILSPITKLIEKFLYLLSVIL